MPGHADLCMLLLRFPVARIMDFVADPESEDDKMQCNWHRHPDFLRALVLSFPVIHTNHSVVLWESDAPFMAPFPTTHWMCYISIFPLRDRHGKRPHGMVEWSMAERLSGWIFFSSKHTSKVGPTKAAAGS